MVREKVIPMWFFHGVNVVNDERTDLHEEEAGTGGWVVVYVDRHEDSCYHDDHHHDDACQ